VLLRVVADGTANLGWLRALTPFGWIEDLRPFSGSDLPWLVLLAAAAAVLVLATVRAAAGRDLGAGALWSGETGRSSAGLLGSELGFTTRSSIMPTAVWTVSIAAFGAVLGLLSVDAAEFAARSPGFRRIAGRIGGIDIGSAKGFIGYAFSMMVVPVCLFVAFRMQAAREEEATGRLDNVLARAVGRRGWMLSQVGVAAAGAAVMAVGIAVATWAAASSRGAGVELGGMLLAAANWLPVVLLFLGIGVLAFAAVPRAAPALSLGAVAVGFLLQLVGMLTKMPRAVLDLSPFHHVAASPAVGVNTGAAAVMLAIGAACAAAGTEVFARRDLAGA
jgi:ABC-2 type transport system permease protein